MAGIKVRKTTIKKKNSNSQKKLYARRVVINNQVQKLNQAANVKRSGTSAR